MAFKIGLFGIHGTDEPLTGTKIPAEIRDQLLHSGHYREHDTHGKHDYAALAEKYRAMGFESSWHLTDGEVRMTTLTISLPASDVSLDPKQPAAKLKKQWLDAWRSHIEAALKDGAYEYSMPDPATDFVNGVTRPQIPRPLTPAQAEELASMFRQAGHVANAKTITGELTLAKLTVLPKGADLTGQRGEYGALTTEGRQHQPLPSGNAIALRRK